MTYQARDYPTRIDGFRRREQLPNGEWADAARLSRQILRRYRNGDLVPRADTLARIVRAASAKLGRKVRASELYDLGEDEPVATTRVSLSGNEKLQKRYNTRFDRTLVRYDIAPTELARRCGMPPQTLLGIREGASPTVRVINLLVKTLRRAGYPVVASDIADVGDN